MAASVIEPIKIDNKKRKCEKDIIEDEESSDSDIDGEEDVKDPQEGGLKVVDKLGTMKVSAGRFKKRSTNIQRLPLRGRGKTTFRFQTMYGNGCHMYWQSTAPGNTMRWGQGDANGLGMILYNITSLPCFLPWIDQVSQHVAGGINPNNKVQNLFTPVGMNMAPIGNTSTTVDLAPRAFANWGILPYRYQGAYNQTTGTTLYSILESIGKPLVPDIATEVKWKVRINMQVIGNEVGESDEAWVRFVVFKTQLPSFWTIAIYLAKYSYNWS